MKETSICGDNRFEIIEKAKKVLLNATNIEDSKEEMKVLSNILFRMWQVGLINEEKLDINKSQKENSIEKLKQELEELYRTQQARLDVGADDLDIREEIAEVEEEIKELQDETMEENSIEEDIEILDLCREYTIKLLELQKIKTKGVNLFEPSKEKKCELAMIDKSIEYLRRNKWKIV